MNKVRGDRQSQPSDARREEVAQATWRVIARDGLDRASLRAIAQELKCTTGVLTHHFRDKDALLDFALQSIVSKLLEIDTKGASDASGPGAVLDIVRDVLPLDSEGKIWWRVWLSFTVAAFSSTAQAQNHARLYETMRRYWTALLSDMQAKGRLRRELDASLEADMLLCLIDGIGIQTMILPRKLTASRQIAIVETHLVRLFNA